MDADSGQSDGGYSYKFVQADQDLTKYTCTTFCQKVFRDPHLTKCCGQHFCHSCLEKWFEAREDEGYRKYCPHCRTRGSEFMHFLNKSLKREINSLKIHCTNNEEGCQWIGELESLKDHLKSPSGCDYVEVECPNKCKKLQLFQIVGITKRKRKDLQTHLKEECYLRPYQCEHCGHNDTYQNITGQGALKLSFFLSGNYHYKKCLEFPLECPKKCGTGNIKRRNINNHRGECPEVEVECPNKCNQKRRRKDIQNHVQNECLRSYTCEFCDRKDTYVEIIRHLVYRKCPESPANCPNKCGIEGIKRKNMVDHWNRECPEELVECEYGCMVYYNPNLFIKVVIKRKKLDKHLKEECPLRPCQCQYCGLMDKYTTITTEHYGKCINFPLECPNKCGVRNIKRSYMIDHRSQCPEEPVQCYKCSRIDKRKDMEDHCSKCPEEEVRCPNKCFPHKWGIKIKRKYLGKHLTNECKLRPYQCEHCGKKDTYNLIIMNHLVVCPEFPLDCPNTCGRNDIKRKDMEDHLSQCPEEEVECPDKCQPLLSNAIMLIKRRNLSKHLANDCRLRPYQCIFCGKKDTYFAIISKHYSLCSEFPVKCLNKCGATRIKRKDVEDHRSQCPEEPVECTNKCFLTLPLKNATMKRKYLKNHLADVCILRPYQCEHCGLKGTYSTITTKHYNICLDFPLECTNKCGEKDIKRKHMKDHRSKCPENPVQCLFEEAGCKEKFVRHQLEQHMSATQQQHLLMVMGAYKETKKENEENKKNYKRLEKENSATKHALRETQQELSQVMRELSETQAELKHMNEEILQLKKPKSWFGKSKP